MNRGKLTEFGKVIRAVAPIDITGAGADGVWVSMKHYDRLAIVLMSGTWAGGTSAITVEQATDSSGTGAKAVAFATYDKTIDADDTPDDTGAVVTVTSNTYTLGDNDNVHVIDVRAADLDGDSGFCFVRVRAATPGANADLFAALYVLYEASYCGKLTTLPSVLS